MSAEATGDAVLQTWPGVRWDGVAALSALVYPPGDPANAAWEAIRWSQADWRIVIVERGILICHVGVYFRQAMVDGAKVWIGGIGGVMTHPGRQRQHHATRALAKANELALAQRMDFGLLVCQDKNIAFYRRFGWQVFGGEMIYAQPGWRGRWTLSSVMVRDINASAPTSGTADLCGLPW